MILTIRKSRTFRGISVMLALSIFFELVQPTAALALTGGPAQPEFNSFTPIGTTDMVDLSSGDMNYNIPLMDVGGYPLNLAYSSGVTMDEEASWVGLGWNLSVGQINHNVRGLPDDFKGDELTYENYMKPNVTVGASFRLEPGAVGVEQPENLVESLNSESEEADSMSLTYGVSAVYNNYTGFVMKPSLGLNHDFKSGVSVGFNAESGPDGLLISPNVSYHKKIKDKQDRENKITINAGVSMNSRQGLSGMTLSASRNIQKKASNDAKKNRASNIQSIGSSISFTDPLYTPTKRVAMETGSFTLNAALGGTFFGVEGEAEITAFGTVMKVKDKKEQVRAYGYNHTEVADKYGVLDFNREKDGSFSVNSTNLPITNYTYDISSVQGQGVSGMYRPFRNQVGYVYDTYVKDGSFSGTFGIEAGSGNLFKIGVDVEGTQVNSHSGAWEDFNHLLSKVEESNTGTPGYEKVHYKNVGDLTADREFGLFDQTGGYQPIYVPIVGVSFLRKAQSAFRKKVGPLVPNYTTSAVSTPIKRNKRHFRNQAIHNVSKKEVMDGVGYGPITYGSGEYTLPGESRDHHTTEVQIIRNDGARYIYGLPAYNLKKREATFAVDTPGDCETGLVSYTPSELEAPKTLPNDKYFNRITTPGYVHTHLLTSVLSTDYVDLTGNGPSVDDLGSYTKFSYQKIQAPYKWRVPFAADMANYNEGFKTDDQDDQGSYVYGEKELYYVNKIETKTHVAIFHYSERKDAKGVLGESGGIDHAQSMYKLDEIKLYSIGEYDDLGLNSASTPIKVVHFEYSYSLCPGVPNNTNAAPTGNEISNHGGKLTLKKVYFTYRNSHMGKYTSYKFNYGEYIDTDTSTGDMFNPDEYSNPILKTAAGSGYLNKNFIPLTVANPTEQEKNNSMISGQNPAYNIKGYDSWGNYLPNSTDCGNRDPLSAPEFPYVNQDAHVQNNRSSVWSLKRINLPSGGTISVEYESDDYSHVQDKGVMRMFKVFGAGANPDGSGDISTQTEAVDLYGSAFSNTPNRYLYVQVDDNAHVTATDPVNAANDIEKYMKGIIGGPPIYFRFLVNTTELGGSGAGDDPAKFDYITGYLEHEETAASGEIFESGGKKYLSIPVRFEDKEGGVINSIPGLTNEVHPVSKAAWSFCRRYLNKHSFSNQPNGDTDDINEIVQDLLSPNSLGNLFEIFTGPNATLENKNVGRQFITEKSWLRLNVLSGEKLGGGCRVKMIKMSDIWEEMNAGQSGYQTMNYGQRYTYTLDGTDLGKTSGVATYEPVGNKENPFVQPVASSRRHLLAPDEDNFVEMPFGESFFPSPQVTYAKVSVANLQAGEAPGANMEVKRLHRTGRVVTEFYTSKDYPTIVDQTRLQIEDDKTPMLFSMLNLTVQQHVTASQGYVIHLNDMNGKQKSQRVYAEGQDVPISGVDYIYDNYTTAPSFSAASNPDQNKGRLNNNVTVINPDGSIERKTIGVEVDVIHDFRENQTNTRIVGVNTNVNNFVLGVIPLAVPVPIPDVTINKDQFRSVTTTKVINTFGILKETIAYDAGAAVYTRNLAWDSMTGEVLVTETIDEFDDKYYTFNYPAHWYYQGMGQATRNLGITGVITSSSPSSYQIQGISQLNKYFIEGDELHIQGLSQTSAGISTVWIKDIVGSELFLMDHLGNDVQGTFGGSQSAVFKVTRSGHRNLQSAGIMNVTLMHNPLTDLSGNPVSNLGTTFLESSNWADWRIINAGAVDYSQNWAPECECDFVNGAFQLRDPNNPTVVLDEITNKYRTNELGVWRTKSSRTYLTGRNRQVEVTPRQQGFFNSFSPMYKLSSNGNWFKDFQDWTFVAEVTSYSPYGFELENRDALDRRSAAQYGYNNTFPMAVGANTEYREIGFDGFEDYIGFDGCPNPHFSFKNANTLNEVTDATSHTGRYSLRVGANGATTLGKKLDCETNE